MGVVYVRNLLTDPWPAGTTKWVQFNGSAQDCEFRMSGDGSTMYFRGLTDVQSSWRYELSGIPAGRMVFGLTTGTAGGLRARVKAAGASASMLEKVLARGNSFYLLPFELATPGCQLVIDGPAKNVAATLNHLLLMTEEDWTHMRDIKNDDGTAANIRWFAPPKTAASGVMSTPALDRGGVSQ